LEEEVLAKFIDVLIELTKMNMQLKRLSEASLEKIKSMV